ncbi:MAG: hypothetical protein WCH10_04520 [bacterium]
MCVKLNEKRKNYLVVVGAGAAVSVGLVVSGVGATDSVGVEAFVTDASLTLLASLLQPTTPSNTKAKKISDLLRITKSSKMSFRAV